MRMKDHLKFGETTVIRDFRNYSFWIIEGTTKNSKKRLVKTKKTMISASNLNSREYDNSGTLSWKSRISLLTNTIRWIRWTMFKMILTPVFTSIFVTILEINHTHLAIGIFSNEKSIYSVARIEIKSNFLPI